MAKLKERKTQKKFSVPVSFAAGWITGAAVLTVMFLLSALVVSSAGFPLKSLELLMSVSVSAAAFVSGWLTARKCGQKGMFCGAAAGVLMFLTAFLPEVLAGRRLPDMTDCIRAALFVPAAMIGGILGIRRVSGSR